MSSLRASKKFFPKFSKITESDFLLALSESKTRSQRFLKIFLKTFFPFFSFPLLFFFENIESNKICLFKKSNTNNCPNFCLFKFNIFSGAIYLSEMRPGHDCPLSFGKIRLANVRHEVCQLALKSVFFFATGFF